MQALESAIRHYVATMEGWSTPDKCAKLAKYILELNAKCSVELGVFAGRGLISMAMAHRHQNYGVAWGFDPWKAEACTEGKNEPENDEWWKKVDLKGIYKGFINNIVMHDLLEYCHWARLKSLDAVKLFEDESVDLLHQDSNHSEEISLAEVDRWHKKIRAGGIWVQDDIDWKTTQKAQKLILKSGFEKIDGTEKWAIYRKKK